MSESGVRRAFVAFHIVLGGVLLVTGHNTLFHSLHEHGFGHLTLVAALEVIAAILFLIPRTVQVGGVALLLVLIPGFMVGLARGGWELQLLVYAAGVWLVMAHGPSWGQKHRLAGDPSRISLSDRGR